MGRLRSLIVGTPVVAVVVFGVLLLLPTMGLGVYSQRQIVLVAIYTLLCSGLNLSFGFAGEVALGQVGVFASGAYLGAILFKHGYTDLSYGFVVALVAAAMVGLVSGAPGLRLSRWALGLVSFFLVLLIPSVTTIFHSQTGGASGLAGIFGPTLFGQPIGPNDFYTVAIVVTMLWMLVFRNLVVSRFGSLLRVLATGSTLAQSLGGSSYRLRMQAYIIGALPAGLAGVLYTYFSGFVSPESFTLAVLIAILAATVVGGADSVWGAPIGAALLVMGPLQVAAFETYSYAVYGAFLILVGTVFSGGLAGLFRGLRDGLLTRFLGTATATPASAVPVDPSVLSIPGERLEVSGAAKAFAGLRALTGVDLVVEPGAITAIIGPNGAGKTTLLNLISGFLRPDAGQVTLAGRSLTGLRPHRVSQLGVGRTFQTPMIPEKMTVLEVVQTGRLRLGRVGMLRSILRLPTFYRQHREDRRAAMAALSFAGLAHLADRDAGSLPLGTRRLLEVVRSVAGEPNILLLDEPAAGLDDEGLRELSLLMRRTRDAGGTVVLVEHNVPFVMEVADHVFAMELGRVIASGPPDVVRNDRRVIDSYLGRRGEPLPQSADPSLDTLAQG